jgi:WD40 repeat protein
MPAMLTRILAIAAILAFVNVIPGAALSDASLAEQEQAAKAMLHPFCADPQLREKFVAEQIKQGGEYEQMSAKWDMDITCEQIDLPTAPVHDTADPADDATHRDWIYDARWSPDGKLIVTASRDKTVRIWDAATGKTVKLIDLAKLPAKKPAEGQLPTMDQSMAAMNGMARQARFLDGGRSIVVAADNHPIRIFDAATGEATGEIPYELADPKLPMPPLIDASASGLVIAGGRGGDILAYDVKAGAERFRIPGAPSDTPYFAISNEAALLAVALPGENGHVRLAVLELETGKPVWAFEAKTAVEYKNNANSVALSRDGRLLGVDVDRLALIFDVKEKKEIARIPTHPYFGHRNLAFTADGKAVIGGLNHAMMTDIATAKRIRHFGPFSDAFHAGDISPDGKHLVTGHLGSDARIWEIDTGTFKRRLGKNVYPPR